MSSFDYLRDQDKRTFRYGANGIFNLKIQNGEKVKWIQSTCYFPNDRIYRNHEEENFRDLIELIPVEPDWVIRKIYLDSIIEAEYPAMEAITIQD